MKKNDEKEEQGRTKREMANKVVVNHLAHNPDAAEVDEQLKILEAEKTAMLAEARRHSGLFASPGLQQYYDARHAHLETLIKAIEDNKNTDVEISEDEEITRLAKARITELRQIAQNKQPGTYYSETARKKAVAELVDIIGVAGATDVCADRTGSLSAQINEKEVPTIAWLQTMSELLPQQSPAAQAVEQSIRDYNAFVSQPQQAVTGTSPVVHAKRSMMEGVLKALVDKGVVQHDAAARAYKLTADTRDEMLRRLGTDLTDTEQGLRRTRVMANTVAEVASAGPEETDNAFRHTESLLQIWENTSKSRATKLTEGASRAMRMFTSASRGEQHSTNKATLALYNHALHATRAGK